jgi:hypothetical protein
VARRAATVVLGAMVGLVLALSPAAKGASVQAPGALRLQGTNGYLIEIMAVPAGFGRPSQVAVLVSKKRSFAIYAAPARVTPTSFAADLGALGKVDVTYHPTGGLEEFIGACQEHLVYPAGYYEGTVEFRGEEGFTEAVSNWAIGRAVDSGNCGETTFVGGTGVDGAVLTAASWRRDRQLFFLAYRNGPRQPARFRVDLLEASGDVAIVRSVSVRGGAGTLRVKPGHAEPVVTVRPPRPFAGVAHFRRMGRRQVDWIGNLRVDLPGKPAVDLIDPITRVDFDLHTDVFESSP